MKKTLIIILVLFGSGRIKSQDLHFSQFQQTPMFQNPALAGSERQTRFILNYRDQWKALGTQFTSIQASADGVLARSKNGDGQLTGGVNIFHDQAMAHLQANASIAYHTPISDFSKVGAGIQFGYAQRSLNTENLQWGSQYDGTTYNPSLPGGIVSGSERAGFMDLGAGIVWQYRRGEKYMTGNDQRQITIGLSVFHPHRPDQSFYQNKDRLYARSVFYADGLFGISNSELSFCPSMLVSSQGPNTEVQTGIRLRRVFERQSNHTGFLKGKAASIGLSYRLQDAIIPSVSLELGMLDMGLSYDINISSLSNATRGRGGPEVSVRYLISRLKQSGSSGRY